MTDLGQVLERASEELARLTGFEQSSVVGARREAEGWILHVEMVERRGVPDTMDVLGLYEVQTDHEGHVMGFERKALRHRGDVDVPSSGTGAPDGDWAGG